jgi:hypothetical protein
MFDSAIDITKEKACLMDKSSIDIDEVNKLNFNLLLMNYKMVLKNCIMITRKCIRKIFCFKANSILF